MYGSRHQVSSHSLLIDFFAPRTDKIDGMQYLCDGYISVDEFKYEIQKYYESPEFKLYGDPRNINYNDNCTFTFAFVQPEFYRVVSRVEKKFKNFDFSKEISNIVRNERNPQ